VSRLPGFAEGFFQIQSEASQLIAYLLSPQPGERVLDACAAPGGKATHIAELMNDTGAVVAADRSARGVEKIRQSAERLGLRSITTECADMTQDVRARQPEPFDRVLVDAPCSGLGTLRGHPEIKWRRTEADLERLSRLQSQILDRAADVLKSGGALVYSTCTISRRENSGVLKDFLGRRTGFELENAADFLPEEARPLADQGHLRSFPHRHNTDGFFAARLRKVA
jgi:16S rRNA (cytosine967-C5)-methyltransferase